MAASSHVAATPCRPEASWRGILGAMARPAVTAGVGVFVTLALSSFAARAAGDAGGPPPDSGGIPIEDAGREPPVASTIGSPFFCRSFTSTIDDCDPNGSCCGSGAPLYWKSDCMPYSISSAGSAKARISADQLSSAMVFAFARWQAAPCNDNGTTTPSIFPVEIGRADCANVEYNKKGPNQNLIVFRDDGLLHVGDATKSPEEQRFAGYETLGLTTVTYTMSGEIVDSDMEINTGAWNIVWAAPGEGADELWKGLDPNGDQHKLPVNIHIVVTHEAGHFLGLAHSPDPKAAMYWSYSKDSKLFNLGAGDRDGICTIYPPKKQGQSIMRSAKAGPIAASICEDNPAPKNGFSSTCGSLVASEENGGCSVAPPAAAKRRAKWFLMAGAAFGVAAWWRRRSVPKDAS